jgi:hypothetical protein
MHAQSQIHHVRSQAFQNCSQHVNNFVFPCIEQIGASIKYSTSCFVGLYWPDVSKKKERIWPNTLDWAGNANGLNRECKRSWPTHSQPEWTRERLGTIGQRRRADVRVRQTSGKAAHHRSPAQHSHSEVAKSESGIRVRLSDGVFALARAYISEPPHQILPHQIAISPASSPRHRLTRVDLCIASPGLISICRMSM